MHSQCHFCLQLHTRHTTDVWPGRKVVYCIKYCSFTHTLSHGHFPLARACAQAHLPEGKLTPGQHTKGKSFDVQSVLSWLFFLSPRRPSWHTPLSQWHIAQRDFQWHKDSCEGEPVFLPAFSLTFSFWANRKQGGALWTVLKNSKCSPLFQTAGLKGIVSICYVLEQGMVLFWVYNRKFKCMASSF